MIDTDTVKRAAAGRWRDILSQLGAIPADLLDGKHHACPRCGGVDRFRLIDNAAGAVLCNKCFTEKNGDGIAALMWLRGIAFPEALQLLAEYLGVKEATNGHRAQIDLIAEICQRKHMPVESLRKFGARLDMRGKLQVCRVPMYDEFGKECSYFDMATIDEKWLKGMAAKDQSPGLFLTTAEPMDGKSVLITEGVKDAAALDGMGYLAVGLPTSEMDVRFNRLFAGADVVVVPDRDMGGEAGAKRTASRIVGIASRVRIATLPTELKESSGDGVREVLAKRHGDKLLRQAIEDAQPWTTESTEPKRITTIVEACNRYLDVLSQGGQQVFYSGVPELDYSISGVAMGEMVVLGARPSHGKSMLALHWLDYAAATGLPGFIVSEEMSALLLGKRAIQRASDIDEYHWPDRVDSIRQHVAEHYDGKPIYIAESLGTTEAAVREIDKAVEHSGVRIVAVDYAQMLKGAGTSRYEQVSNTSLELKKCATRNGIIVLLLCQLSREIEKRTEHVPKMSDLRESGQIEQDADVILFLQWPIKLDPKYKPHDEYRIYVAKNRNRQIKSNIVVARFDPSRQTIFSASVDPFENAPSYSDIVNGTAGEF